LGHERVGYLPKTQKWKTIVDAIIRVNNDTIAVPEIASQTLRNVSEKFLDLKNDSAFLGAFKFLVTVSHCQREEDPIKFLQDQGINLPNSSGLFHLSKEVNSWMERQGGSKEYATLATKALINTLTNWVNRNSTQVNLFTSENNILNSLTGLSEGSGFCDVSRDYFSRFTTHYLSYFLDRAASSNINSIQGRNEFSNRLNNHIHEISNHSFETAKIAQSFSAGWLIKMLEMKCLLIKR